jgi:hypothetical protein
MPSTASPGLAWGKRRFPDDYREQMSLCSCFGLNPKFVLPKFAEVIVNLI